MADSDALRSRRKRLHAAGDHHLCRHWPQPALVPDLPAGRRSGEFDPAAEMRALADRLTAAHEADPGNPALARELRAALLALGAEPGALDPELAEMFRAFRT